MESLLVTVFEMVGTFYSVIVPIALLLIVTLLFIASMLQPGAKPKQVGEAIYCYLMESVGISLMTLGALPTIVSVLNGHGYSSIAYLGLLFVFAIGGIVFLWHDHHEQMIDAASKAIPEAIYFSVFKILGHFIALFAGLSLLLTIIFGAASGDEWWILPTVLLCYGLLLCWCTSNDTTHETHIFQRVPLRSRKASTAPSNVDKMEQAPKKPKSKKKSR